MSMLSEERICEVIVRWMNLFGFTSTPIKSLEELSDGVLFFQILAQLSPKHFDLGSIALTPHSGFAKISNMKQLKGALERFYADVLNDDLFFKDTIEPAALAFGRQPKDFVSLMEVLLLAAIKSENKEEAVDKMLKLDASDQMFLVQLLDDLTRQNGFVDPNGGDIGNDTLLTPIGMKNGGSNNTNTNNNNNNANKLNDSQFSFLQLSARKYDKTRRLAMQSPVIPRYTRSILNGNTNGNGNSNSNNNNQGNEATFEFRAFDTNGNGSSANQLLMSPPQSRGVVGKLTNDMYSTSSQYLLDANKKDFIRQLEQENLTLQNDLARYQTECKQLVTENTRIKDEYKFLEDRVRNNMTQELQRKEKDYLGKIALLEEQSTSFCKEMKNYETTIRSLRSENDKLTKELAQLGSLHDTQIRQYREELEMTKLQLNRMKSYDMQFKKYPQDDLATSTQTKEVESLKFRNDQLFNENFDLKCQLKQIPQFKEQVEQYKQQLMDYKIRGVGSSQRSGDTLQEVLDELHVQKRQCAQTQNKYQDALKELTELKEKLKMPSFRGLDCKKCDELQKQIEAITQFSTEQKKKLKEYHSALEQLHTQKTNDCELHKGYIESLRQQVQELQDEKKLTHESYQRELLGVSNAFYGLALEKTVQSGNMNLNSDDKLGLLHKNLELNGNRASRNSFDLMTSRKGKENIPQFYTTDDLKLKSYDWKNLEFGNSNSASNLNLNSYRSSLTNTYAMAAASNQNKLQQDVSRTRLQQSKNYFGNNV